MKEYWIDFSGYLKVEAENADEAERKFWHAVNTKCPFLGRDGFSDDVWDLDATEECVNELECEPVYKNDIILVTQKELEDFWGDK